MWPACATLGLNTQPAEATRLELVGSTTTPPVGSATDWTRLPEGVHSSRKPATATAVVGSGVRPSPRRRVTTLPIEKGSAAARAGIQKGDGVTVSDGVELVVVETDAVDEGLALEVMETDGVLLPVGEAVLVDEGVAPPD